MIRLSKETIALLEDIERRIDPETEEDFVNQWKDFTFGRFDGEIFMSCRKKLSQSNVKTEAVCVNDAIGDYELMLRQQMNGISAGLNHPRPPLCIRANYGSGIMTSIFGAEIAIMDRKANLLPITRSLNDTSKIEEIISNGIPNLYTGFGKNMFEFGEFCLEVFEKYPKIKKYVTVYHADTQGPIDICELLWGCDMFLTMYDEPELVHSLLRLVTDTYKAVMDKWFGMFPAKPEINPHWGFYHRGSIVLRDDSAMNLSPESYAEFVARYDNELLETYGGGVIHFCGRGDHYIDIISRMPKLYGVNITQPHLNDMEKIYQNTVDKGIKILNFPDQWAQKDKKRPGQYHHNMNT